MTDEELKTLYCSFLLFFIAISSYKDYSNRVKIAEAISILAGLKIPTEKYYDSKGVWPAIVESASIFYRNLTNK